MKKRRCLISKILSKKPLKHIIGIGGLKIQKHRILSDNHDNVFSFCESEMGSYSDKDRVKDVVGNIDEEEVCGWSEND